MKYLIFVVMMFPIILQGQVDTTAATVSEVYEYEVVSDSVYQPVDSTWVITKRLVEKRIQSPQEQANLERYYTQSIKEITARIKDSRADLEVALKALEEAGEPKRLAKPIRDRLKGLREYRDQHKASLAALLLDRADTLTKFESRRLKKYQEKIKLSDDDEEKKEPLDIDNMTNAELRALLEDMGLPTSGKKSILIQRLRDNGVE